jgi:glycosyltransferase involved in cell wall biosynthesis
LSEEGITREAYVEEDRLWALMAACDVCVNLRAPTMGETSGSAIRALSLGKPLVVSDLGWFSELPDAVAARVPVDEREVEALAAVLSALCTRADVRTAMGAAARAHAESEHKLSRVAELYAAALEEAAGGARVREAVVGDVALAAADVGIEPGSAEAAEIGARLREAGAGE